MAPPVHFDSLRDFVVNRRLPPGIPNRFFQGWYNASGTWCVQPRYAMANAFVAKRSRYFDHYSVLESVQMVPSPSLAWEETFSIDTSEILYDNQLYSRTAVVYGNPDGTTRQTETDSLPIYGAISKCPIYLGRDEETPIDPYWKYETSELGTSECTTTSSSGIKRACKTDSPSVLTYTRKHVPKDDASWTTTVDQSLITTTDTTSVGSWGTNTPSTFYSRRMYFIIDSSILTPSSTIQRMWYFFLAANDYRTGLYSYPSGSRTWEVNDCILHSGSYKQCIEAHTTSSFSSSKWTVINDDIFNIAMDGTEPPWEYRESDTILNEPIYGVYGVNMCRNDESGDYTFIPTLSDYSTSNASILYQHTSPDNCPLRVLYMNKAKKTEIYGSGWPF